MECSLFRFFFLLLDKMYPSQRGGGAEHALTTKNFEGEFMEKRLPPIFVDAFVSINWHPGKLHFFYFFILAKP